jgi:hypothetical protein
MCNRPQLAPQAEGSTRAPNLAVKLFNQFVELRNLVLKQRPPEIQIPLGVQFFAGFALLLNPRVVLQVVNRLPLGLGEFLEAIHAPMRQRSGEVGDGVLRAVCAALLLQFFDA